MNTPDQKAWISLRVPRNKLLRGEELTWEDQLIIRYLGDAHDKKMVKETHKDSELFI